MLSIHSRWQRWCRQHTHCELKNRIFFKMMTSVAKFWRGLDGLHIQVDLMISTQYCRQKISVRQLREKAIKHSISWVTAQKPKTGRISMWRVTPHTLGNDVWSGLRTLPNIPEFCMEDSMMQTATTASCTVT